MGHVALLVLAAVAAVACARLGDSWGTNIHWTQGQPGEAAMLSKAFKVARMDFGWQTVEAQCGVYNFTQYDGLLEAMESNGKWDRGRPSPRVERMWSCCRAAAFQG